MKLFGRNVELSKGNETAFINELIACRINAMIEVLDLPVELLQDADPDSIRHKLLELSDDQESWQTPEARMAWLDDVIGRICENDEMVERVMSLTRKKFRIFMSIPESAAAIC
jgi:hypothetical protein